MGFKDALTVTSFIAIPFSEFSFQYARSSGAGGQNVNKVNSKAILYWVPEMSPSLPPGVKERFLERYRSRLSNTGDLQIQSDRFRDQGRNAQDCLAKLQALILAVAYPPKKRKATRPTRASQKKRLESKRRHAEKKQARRRLE